VEPTPPADMPRPSLRRRRIALSGAMVAIITAITVSTNAARHGRDPAPGASHGERDTSFAIAVAPGHRPGTLDLSWPRLEEAIEYRIDLTAADGQPLGVLGPFQDPSFTFASGSGPGLESGREVSVRIVALGNDRIVRASAPVRVTLP